MTRPQDQIEEADPHPNVDRVTLLVNDDALDGILAKLPAGVHIHFFDLTKVNIPIPMPAGDGETYITVCRG